MIEMNNGFVSNIVNIKYYPKKESTTKNLKIMYLFIAHINQYVM